MYVSRQECLLHLFKLWFEVSIERVNHLRQIACICFHFPKQQGVTCQSPDTSPVVCMCVSYVCFLYCTAVIPCSDMRS